mmetsp:Transcript_16972/g.19583  ORF Transcript_16972/g.19583 Transcript_16972/m.19583 type:complete len:85 (+) Transcript_16972:14-268(+)
MAKFFRKFNLSSKEEEKEAPPKRSFWSFSRLNSDPKPDLEKSPIKSAASAVVRQANKQGRALDSFAKKHLDPGRSLVLSAVFLL